jgi:hypothetical protein
MVFLLLRKKHMKRFFSIDEALIDVIPNNAGVSLKELVLRELRVVHLRMCVPVSLKENG